MNETRLVILATTGILFMQCIDPSTELNTSSSYHEFFIRTGLSLFVGIITTLTYKFIESLKIWQRLTSQGKRFKQQISRKQLKK
jgi:hypothetical protein